MSGGKTSALGKEVSGRYVLLPLSKRALYSEFCGHPYLFLLKYSLNEPTLCHTKMPSSGSLGRRVQLFAARFYRGIDIHCWMPPAQIPAGVIQVPGTHVGRVTTNPTISRTCT